jgi:hypothetical protein
MKLWISEPEVVIPPLSCASDEEAIPPAYQRILDSYSRWLGSLGGASRVADAVGEPLVPRGIGLTAEDLAVEAVSRLLASLPPRFNIELLIDCRSSPAVAGPAPTYMVAYRSGLVRALPLSLGGQAGSEVAQALCFLRRIRTSHLGAALIVATQRVVWPDPRLRLGSLPLGDAAAAILVAPTPIIDGAGYWVDASVTAHRAGDWPAVLERVVSRAERVAGIRRERIGWSLAHRCPAELEPITGAFLPNIAAGPRSAYADVDFGCADVLVSLHALRTTPQRGLGCAWFAGRFGDVGFTLLEACDTARRQGTRHADS